MRRLSTEFSTDRTGSGRVASLSTVNGFWFSIPHGGATFIASVCAGFFQFNISGDAKRRRLNKGSPQKSTHDADIV